MTIVCIDAVENFKTYHAVLGNPMTPLLSFTDNVKADYMLFAHLHLDHFNPTLFINQPIRAKPY
ncbi:MAG: hypothetical protein QM530_05270 [Phycisphaerales bacterium]|nr:hypothetical protein [Phycisphaerales bacterium]